ncbi:MAG: phosphopantothenoylcysteine decarboxylase [Chthoniobacteraceae bacterium]
MRVIVTCGPSFEPIDGVRRLTNFSTGELGLLLAAELVRAGHEVLCLNGEGAVSRADAGGARVITFSTNANLLERLRELGATGAGAVFHAAALCDYQIETARTSDGARMTARKFPSRAGELTLTLKPALKLLPALRGIFPAARIVGWKYELDGTRSGAETKAREQIAACGTDACVVNGAAWGAGFGFIEPGREVVAFADKPTLSAFLARWPDAGKIRTQL